MLFLFKHSHHLLTNSSFKVTVPFLSKMSSSTRSLRSRAVVKTEQDVSDNKGSQSSRRTSKYFQDEQIKGELDVPVKNKVVVKGTKNPKAIKIKQEHQKMMARQESNVPKKIKKVQALKAVIKTEPDASEIVKTEVLSDDDDFTRTNSKLEIRKGGAEKVSPQKRKLVQKSEKVAKQGSNVSTKAKKVQALKTVIKTEPDASEIVKTEVLSDDDFTRTDSKLAMQKGGAEKVSLKKRKQAQKSEKVSKVKTEHVRDVEDIGWEPPNWKVVLDNILQMRKLHVAPVDSLGCEECPEKGVLPEVFRYQTLISVMLSSQTRDEVTFAATQRLVTHGLTVDSILETSDERIGELIYPAGFWKSKVKYIRNTTQILKDQYNGDIPRTFKDLCKLPGVGPKMANIVMSVGWNDTVGIAVDTHVHRISNRLGWVPKPTKDPEHTRKALEAWMPKTLWKDVSLHLVGFGQTLCKPLKPKCQDCLNCSLCPSSTVKL